MLSTGSKTLSLSLPSLGSKSFEPEPKPGYKTRSLSLSLDLKSRAWAWALSLYLSREPESEPVLKPWAWACDFKLQSGIIIYKSCLKFSKVFLLYKSKYILNKCHFKWNFVHRLNRLSLKLSLSLGSKLLSLSLLSLGSKTTEPGAWAWGSKTSLSWALSLWTTLLIL
jgi:hypothetical protein